jgi:hypothetical protein
MYICEKCGQKVNPPLNTNGKGRIFSMCCGSGIKEVSNSHAAKITFIDEIDEKDKTMIKPIFENEEEFDIFFDNTIMECYKESIPSHTCGYDVNLTKKLTRENAKERGYIKKNIVEEAEQMYNSFYSPQGCARTHRDIIDKQNEAIKHLKKQLSEKDK